MSLMSDSDANFLRAVRAGHLEEVVAMLDKGHDVNTVNFNGMSGLHLAAKEGHVGVMVELLNRGANPEVRTQKENTPLHVAALARQTNVTRLLLDRGADVNAASKTGFTPLYLAAQENGADIVDMLLQAGADQRIHTVDGFSPLAVAVQQENAEVISVLLPNWRKTAADFALRLLTANMHECPDVLKHTADGNVIGLRKAIQYGTDVNQTLKDGLSPLHMAVVLGDLQMVRELITHGALPNTTSEKLSTPLGTACYICRRDIMQALLDAGANPNVKSRPCDPLMPLHIVCNHGDAVGLQMLLENGADVTAAGKWMSMNSRVAFDAHHTEVISLCIRWALKLCPEQNKPPSKSDSESTDTQPPPTPEEPDRDPAATCLVMMCPLFRSRPKQVDSIVAAAMETVSKDAIFKAAEEGDMELVKECMSESPKWVDTKSQCGVTLLHVACMKGHTAMVSFLLQHGASINATTDKGLTPAILAAYSNQPEVLEMLIQAGADLTLCMQNGLTPLGMAIAKQNLASSESVLRHQPLAPPCNILSVLSTQQNEEAPSLSKVLGMVEWACRSNPLTASPSSSAHHRKKGRRACLLS
ncbi:uncharacterized protein LOC143285862 [Babylonia areolata]|uniref:uncharacterized protein LOC143285862 n=1 Tax=Babylonia areolata TaxID=304850 RepID=UPI003FCF5C40